MKVLVLGAAVEVDEEKWEALPEPLRQHLQVFEGQPGIPTTTALLLAELEEDDGSREADLRSRLPVPLESEDLELLTSLTFDARVPPLTPLKLAIKVKGVAGQPGFSIRASWNAPTGRPLAFPPELRDGGVRFSDGPWRRLSYGQDQVLSRLSSSPETGHDRSRDLEFQATVIGCIPIDDPCVVLDAFLERDRAVKVDAVKPRLIEVDGSYQIRPHADQVRDSDLCSYFYDTPKSELGNRVLTVSKGVQRQRVVFGERAVRGLHRSRKIDILPKREAARAVSQPQEVLGDDFDLSELSERVVGLGPPVYRATPTLRELKSKSWWDWEIDLDLGTVDEGEAPREEVPGLKDPKVRRDLRRAIEEADADGARYTPNPRGPGFIEVTSELRTAIDAADHLQKEEERSTGGRLRKKPQLVLQVLENVESLVFDRAALRLPERPREPIRPPGLSGHLHPHQNVGYTWLRALFGSREESKARSWSGALLADDMGLGKTLQVLSLLSDLRGRQPHRPHLIVAPVSLLENWRREAELFFPGRLRPSLIARGAGVPKDPDLARGLFDSTSIVLTSYETLRRKELSFARVSWRVMVLDEAQKAKDPATQIARVVRTINAEFRLAVTGTPVENSLKELWTLFDWAVPGLLGSLRRFGDEFIKPLGNADPDERRDLGDALYKVIGPVFVRRLKGEKGTVELPPIYHHPIEVTLSPMQESKYEDLVAGAKKTPNPLGFLQRLFAICAHPELDRSTATLSRLQESPFPKGEAVFGRLDKIARLKEKAIVFARWRAIQQWIVDEAIARYDIPVACINGLITESERRLKMVEEFSERQGFGVLVLAPRAAGTGLNITAANHVLHYTREWNPAVEKQATDRAHRIGQTRPVHVYTFTATSTKGTTVEEKLADLLEEKERLFRDFVVPLGGFEIKPEQFL